MVDQGHDLEEHRTREPADLVAELDVLVPKPSAEVGGHGLRNVDQSLGVRMIEQGVFVALHQAVRWRMRLREAEAEHLR